MNYFFSKRAMLALAVFSSIMLTSCSDDEDTDEYGNWVESSSFDGDSRSSSVTFTIDGKGYVVGGYDGDDYLADTWEYNPDDNFWVKKDANTSFTGDARSGAVGFEINGKGYYGTGYNGTTELSDFWEYDPSTDTWTSIASFPGTARYGAVGFSIGSYGYVGTGDDGSEQKDFYRYDPSTDTWDAFSDLDMGFPGEKRQEAYVFVIDDVAYIGGGLHNGSYEEDFYSFDGSAFTRLEDLDDDDDDDDDYSILVSNGTAFALNGKGYVATGLSGVITTNTWEYDPTTDTWDELPAFEGSARQDASAFSFDDQAFVLMGRSSNYYFDDVWELRPEELENEDD